MVIKNTRHSRSNVRKSQVERAPKVEEKKIEEAELAIDPSIEEIAEPVIKKAEAQIEEDIEVEHEEKRPAPRKKKKIVKKQEETISTQEKSDTIEPDDVEELLEKLLEED